MDEVTMAKNEYRLRELAELARERTESGETVRDFCANRGIAVKTYYYRLRKVREAMLPSMAPPQAVVPVSGAYPLVEPPNGAAMILHTGELTAEISGSATPEQIRALVTALRATC